MPRNARNSMTALHTPTAVHGDTSFNAKYL